jgi:hypothetical protein
MFLVSRRFGPVLGLFGGLQLHQEGLQPTSRGGQIMLAGTGDCEQLAGQSNPLVGAHNGLAKPFRRRLQQMGEIDEIPLCVGILGHNATMTDDVGGCFARVSRQAPADVLASSPEASGRRFEPTRTALRMP